MDPAHGQRTAGLGRRVAEVVGRRRGRALVAAVRRDRLPHGGPADAARRVLRGRPGRGGPLLATADVAALETLVRSLDGAGATALVDGLTDADLRAWHDRLQHLPPGARDATYVAVGERVALGQWRRFGAGTDDVDPEPSGDLRDLARIEDPTSPFAAEVREWVQWTGPFAVHGPGDAHAFAANDVVQGHIGNCYLVAALQAIADTAPHRLASLCTANTNGTWTVALPGGRRTVVSPDVVVDVHGRAVFARRPPRGEVELWPMVLEKAWAQLHGGWDEIVAGHTQDAVALLTGVPGHVVAGRDLDLAYLARWWRADAVMVVKTIPVPEGSDPVRWVAEAAPAPFRWPGSELDRLHPGHAFVVRGVDEGAGTVTLGNPWGIEDGAVVLDLPAVRACIDSLHVTQLGD